MQTVPSGSFSFKHLNSSGLLSGASEQFSLAHGHCTMQIVSPPVVNHVRRHNYLYALQPMSYVIHGPDDVIAFISSLVLMYSVQTEWGTLFFGLLKFSGRVFVYCGFVFVFVFVCLFS